MSRRSGRVGSLALAVVVLFAIANLALSVLRHREFTPDGIVYARYAARDAGASEADATLAARAFYEKTSMMAVPRYRRLIELDPSVSFSSSRIFENRVLYPWVVSRLLPWTGFRALFIVSAISYVLFGIALFWLLTAWGRPWFAAVFTMIALALPLTRSLAASDLTDMLAAVWWTLALGALVRLLRAQTPAMLVTLAVASVLLVLTRPTPYLIVLPALAAGLLRGRWLSFLASLSGVAAYVLVAALTHAFGAGEQLRWVYTHEPHAPGVTYNAWYRAAVLSTIRYVIVEAVRTIAPVMLTAAAVYLVFRSRVRDDTIVLIAAAIACLIAVPFNPVPFAIGRVLVFPLLPVFCAIAQVFAATVLMESLGRGPVHDVAA